MRIPFIRQAMARPWIVFSAILAIATAAIAWEITEYKSGIVWPEVKVIEPGEGTSPPSDAVVLFDGKSLAKWTGGENWIIKDGYAIADKNGITTKEPLGSCQFHIEWATPEKIEGTGQGRGNSGVYFMGFYELQILDSFGNTTYPDGQAAAIYKQQPPLVNASRKPGEWQSYDIVFIAPKFDKEGKVVRPAAMTAFHNGVLVQNHFELTGETSWHKAPAYTAHPDKLPLNLQFHGNPVRFRNIWYRPL